MKPSDILKSEHRVIEQVLDCLEKMVEQVEGGGAVDAASVAQAVDFIHNFVDRCHHGKEESHFFPALEAKGYSRDCGPTGVMLREHELGRQHVGQMNDALAGAQSGDAAARERFIEHARAFISLLREHIHKEDHCLFGMADQAFSPGDQQQLLDAFTHVETEHMGTGTHEKYLRIADELAERFQVPRLAAATTGCPSCGGH